MVFKRLNVILAMALLISVFPPFSSLAGSKRVEITYLTWLWPAREGDGQINNDLEN